MSLSQELGERKIAPAVLYPTLGEALVDKLNARLPTFRMTQDEVMEVMEICTRAYYSMLHRATPGASEPIAPYQQGELEDKLRACRLQEPEVMQVSQQMHRDMHDTIAARKAELADDFKRANVDRSYQRLRLRESSRALSLTPQEDARELAEALGLQSSTAIRFEKAYTEYVKEQHKLHVASADLERFMYGVAGAREVRPSNRVMDAKERSDELMETMVTMLEHSESDALRHDAYRAADAREILLKALFSSSPPAEPAITAKIDLSEPSDYRFIRTVRQHLQDSPEHLREFDDCVATLLRIADGTLDPDKISQFSGPLMQKQGKGIQTILGQEGIANSPAIATRILNTFTKQVDLVQSKATAKTGLA